MFFYGLLVSNKERDFNAEKAEYGRT